jgi:hypothetical protein
VWALLLGSIMALIQFFLGSLISPGGFGFSRWLFGFVDIVSLPVLIPLFIYTILVMLRGTSGDIDFASFALLWIVPIAALQAVNWSSQNDPLLLVTVPMLWTALAVGISFFINCIINYPRWFVVIPLIIFIFILPVTASGSYWAFFSQQSILGFSLFIASQIPLLLSVIFDIYRKA